MIPTTSARQLASPPPLARDGAETEVETDLLGHEPRSRRQRPTVRTGGHIAAPPSHLDPDAEMLDGEAEEADGGDDEESQNHDRQAATGFVSRGPGFGLPLALPGNSSGPRDDGSEGDGSRSASAEGVMVGHEGVLQVEPVISGKRKR